MTTLLLDGDVLAYKAAAACEVALCDDEGYWTWFCNEKEVRAAINGEIATYLDELGADGYVLALTDSAENFRKTILPTYKGNRANVKRPVALKAIREWMLEEHETFLRPGLEGDDVMGILQTWPKFQKEHGKTIIVSIDKDMKTIPGWYVRDLETGPVEITEEEADYWHMYQTLTGDSTDGYSGCPGIGPKRAAAALSEADEMGLPLWECVVNLYRKAKLGEEEALTQARVARILRYQDYDFKKKEPILWVPGESG